MAAIVSGSKRSFVDDIPSPPLSKRFRCSSSPSPSPLDYLRSEFPHLEVRVLERALEECGNDRDSAVKSLQELSLASSEPEPDSAPECGGAKMKEGEITNVEQKPPALDNLPSRTEWMELFVGQMANATSLDDAKVRASGMLEMLEKSISSQVRQESAQSFQKEYSTLKQQNEVLVKENSFLKRFVAAQHERLKQHENLDQQTQQLKQLISQYQEKIRTLEVNNYALTMYLKQAEQTSFMPGHLPPDVF